MYFRHDLFRPNQTKKQIVYNDGKNTGFFLMDIYKYNFFSMHDAPFYVNILNLNCTNIAQFYCQFGNGKIAGNSNTRIIQMESV